MIKGDYYHKKILKKILEEGTLDENPRPVYIDRYSYTNYHILHTKRGRIVSYEDENGEKQKILLKKENRIFRNKNGFEIHSPAHTYSVNHIMTQYDISKGECPIVTLRPTAWKSGVKEIFWIYQMQSNKLEDLHKMGISYWDEWDIGDGTIGCRYGATIYIHQLIQQLLDGLKKDPFGRRHIMNMWQEDDFSDETGGTTKGLVPCCYETIWNVRKKDGVMYLDMLMNQRSSDFAVSVAINELQYVALLLMVAKHCGYQPGVFTHVTENVQIYDRHVKNAKELIRREPIECQAKLVLNVPDGTDFFDIRFEDFELVDYPLEQIKEENPQLKFDLGV